MSLITQPVTAPALIVPQLPTFEVAITEEALEQRKFAVELSQEITVVSSPSQRDDAIAAVSLIKGLEKKLDAVHEEVKKPALRACQAIDKAKRDYLSTLLVEKARVEKLLKTYQTECDARAEQLRQEEIANMPKPVNEDAMREQAVRIVELNQKPKVDGASVRKDWEYDVIDAMELAQARPDLVTIEVKVRELKAALTIANGIIPGVSARIVSNVLSKASV